MNELKPEDMVKDLETAIRNGKFFGYSTPKVTYKQLQVIITLLRENDAEIERLTAYNANLICANTDITNRHKDYVEEAERIARADAITEFAEGLKNSLNDVARWSMHGVDGEYFIIGKPLIDRIAKEMKGETDERSD